MHSLVPKFDSFTQFMNQPHIDVSKGKSMVVAMRTFGTVVILPFEVKHTAEELSRRAESLGSLDSEIRAVMKAIGNSWSIGFRAR